MSLVAAPLLRLKQNFAFASETTTGSAATLNAAAGVTAVYNPSIKFNTEVIERQSQGSLSPIEHALGAAQAEATFETDLVGSGTGGTAPLWASVLLAACGLTSSSGGVWTPLDGANQTVTLGHYINGRLRQCLGAMGSFKITFKRGQKAVIQWTFKGLKTALSSATIAPTYVTVTAPVAATASFLVGGTAYYIPELTFDAGNQLQMREDFNSANGYLSAMITNRKPMVSFAPEALLAQDWDGNFRSLTNASLSIAVGTVSGNTWTLAAPNMQLKKDPEDGDRNATLTDVLEWECKRNSSAGGDEYSLTMG